MRLARMGSAMWCAAAHNYLRHEPVMGVMPNGRFRLDARRERWQAGWTKLRVLALLLVQSA
jgi:hypothetical protein